MADLKTIVGNRVHDLRISYGLKQSQLAEIIDISDNFLSEIENGKKGMSQETIYKLCSKLSVSADYIIFGTDTKNGISSSQVIEYVNKLDIKELQVLSNYLISLIELKRTCNS